MHDPETHSVLVSKNTLGTIIEAAHEWRGYLVDLIADTQGIEPEANRSYREQLTALDAAIDDLNAPTAPVAERTETTSGLHAEANGFCRLCGADL